jgi:hypothetical protein
MGALTTSMRAHRTVTTGSRIPHPRDERDLEAQVVTVWVVVGWGVSDKRGPTKVITVERKE